MIVVVVVRDLGSAGWLTVNFLKAEVVSAIPDVLIRILHIQTTPRHRTTPTKATGAQGATFSPASLSHVTL